MAYDNNGDNLYENFKALAKYLNQMQSDLGDEMNPLVPLAYGLINEIGVDIHITCKIVRDGEAIAQVNQRHVISYTELRRMEIPTMIAIVQRVKDEFYVEMYNLVGEEG